MLAAGVVLGMQIPVGDTSRIPPTSDGTDDRDRAAEAETDASRDRSESGAVSVAAAYLARLGSEEMLDPATRAQTFDEIALPDARDDVTELMQGIDLVVDRLNLSPELVSDPGFVLRTIPAGYRVTEFSGKRAVVEVWQTSVFVASGRDVPAESTWHTTVFELRWVDGQWRIAGLSGREGPAPSAEGTSADTVGRRIDRFEEFRHAPE